MSSLAEMHEWRRPFTLVGPQRRRVVCFGGGTGLPVVLRGLKRHREVELTAVVAMSDDGGSSGRLRRSRGLLPPGDIRNCLVALARRPSPLADLFQYRFGGSRDLAGHALGNLLIAAIAEQKGDFLEAVRLASRLLGVKGCVLPSTLAPVRLVADVEDGNCVVGEHQLERRRGRVRRVSLMPRRPPAAEGLLEAIADADLVVYGPGSLYSSLLPNLLVDGVADALQRSRSLKVLVSNLMTEPGETEGMAAEEHVQAVIDHAGPVVDVVLGNRTLPEPAVLERYARKGAAPLKLDRAKLARLGVALMEADLLQPGPRVRHHRTKLARCLMRLAHTGI